MGARLYHFHSSKADHDVFDLTSVPVGDTEHPDISAIRASFTARRDRALVVVKSRGALQKALSDSPFRILEVASTVMETMACPTNFLYCLRMQHATMILGHLVMPVHLELMDMGLTNQLARVTARDRISRASIVPLNCIHNRDRSLTRSKLISRVQSAGPMMHSTFPEQRYGLMDRTVCQRRESVRRTSQRTQFEFTNSRSPPSTSLSERLQRVSYAI